VRKVRFAGWVAVAVILVLNVVLLGQIAIAR
jgi:hypothetical protein